MEGQILVTERGALGEGDRSLLGSDSGNEYAWSTFKTGDGYCGGKSTGKKSIGNYGCRKEEGERSMGR